MVVGAAVVVVGGGVAEVVVAGVVAVVTTIVVVLTVLNATASVASWVLSQPVLKWLQYPLAQNVMLLHADDCSHEVRH